MSEEELRRIEEGDHTPIGPSLAFIVVFSAVIIGLTLWVCGVGR
jgi:hypothetical protein